MNNKNDRPDIDRIVEEVADEHYTVGADPFLDFDYMDD